MLLDNERVQRGVQIDVEVDQEEEKEIATASRRSAGTSGGVGAVLA